MDDAAIDAVYTWVDDAWPGYLDRLNEYASTRHDLNPNRTRDNLQTLKYSLRSLAAHAPWIRQVVLVTARPQVPPWLNRREVRVVHHDECLPAADLPTFNSFAIVSNLHRVPQVSRRFLYVEDDHLFGAPLEPADLFGADGRPRVFLKAWDARPPAVRHDERLSPWNRALALSNHLLDARYGARRRRTAGHTPLAIDTESWRAMIDVWPDAFARTSASRFRATGNVAPEHLYRHFLLEERRGVLVPRLAALREAGYHPLNNVTPFQRANLARLRWQRPTFICMNDGFGARPSAAAVAAVRAALERWFPRPSRFEVA